MVSTGCDGGRRHQSAGEESWEMHCEGTLLDSVTAKHVDQAGEELRVVESRDPAGGLVSILSMDLKSPSIIPQN